MVRSARIHRLVREAATFGTRAESVRLDWETVVRRQREIVQAVRPAPESLTKTGAKVCLGEARFTDPHTVEVNGAAIHGEKIVIGAGSEPIVPRIEGRELAITSDQLLFLPEFPAELTLVGAGAIGLEMASAFADLGARVTVVGQESEILPMFDADVAAYIRKLLEAKGVTVHCDSTVTRLTGRPGAVVTRIEESAGPIEVRSAQVCLAVGRRFNAGRLGADRIGLELAGPGLKVTPYLRTSLPHIYAAGDAAGTQMLTPVAAYEGRLAARNALQGDVEAADYSVVPQTIFTTPEIGKVGITHRDALARGIRCHVSTHDLRGASNGRATGEDGGYLKLVFDGPTERLLGVQMVSYAAAELIQLAALAVRTGATADTLGSLLSIHPSHGERFLKVAAHDHHEVCEVA
ncbi:MAG: NAD(P)/FAD-dependent oxidoreductase [Candidatus Rokubacteria bacterium]|nr:NAD(P)/FAD-dependent oxidoreductase [Candidatus Rokubacteria bacterium]